MAERIEAPEGMMVQWAPFPTVLAELVGNLDYKPGWTFRLVDMVRDRDEVPEGTNWWEGAPLAGGLTFVVGTNHRNAYRDWPRPVSHLFPVPAATFNREAWDRWIHDRLLDVDRHEAGEWHVNFDGEGVPHRPFAPTHGPGDNPYTIVQYATDEQRKTAFTGALNE